MTIRHIDQQLNFLEIDMYILISIFHINVFTLLPKSSSISYQQIPNTSMPKIPQKVYSLTLFYDI